MNERENLYCEPDCDIDECHLCEADAMERGMDEEPEGCYECDCERCEECRCEKCQCYYCEHNDF